MVGKESVQEEFKRKLEYLQKCADQMDGEVQQIRRMIAKHLEQCPHEEFDDPENGWGNREYLVCRQPMSLIVSKLSGVQGVGGDGDVVRIYLDVSRDTAELRNLLVKYYDGCGSVEFIQMKEGFKAHGI